MTISTARSLTGSGTVWISLVGVALALLGMSAMAFPFIATLSVEVMVGCFLAAAGALSIVHAFMERGWRGFAGELLMGLIYVIGGLFFLVNPLGGALVLTVMLGIVFITDGIARCILAFGIRPERYWGWVFAGGCLAILIGTLVLGGLANGASLAFIGFLVGINFFFAGVSFIALGFTSYETETDASLTSA